MCFVNLCVGVYALVFLTMCMFNAPVHSVDINCVPIDNCTFASNILANRGRTTEVLNFLNYSVCGYDNVQNKVKIWCNKFTNCRTPDNKHGTCIYVKKCAAFVDLLQTANDDPKAKEFLNQYRCDLPFETEIHVCCPKPPRAIGNRFDFDDDSTNLKTSKKNFWNQESRGQNRRHSDDYPWFYRNRHNHFFDGQNFEHHSHGFGNTNFPKGFGDSLKGNPVSVLQNSLQQQNKWLQDALYNSSRNILNVNNNNNKVFSWLKPHNNPPKENTNHYNLSEETFTSKQENCVTPGKFEGTCKSIKDCPAFLTLLKTLDISNSSQSQFLLSFRCSGGTETTEVTVCCNENEINISNTVPIQSNGTQDGIQATNESSTAVPDNLEFVCGRQISDNKILGGTVTTLGEFPWTALLQYTSSNGLTYGCGGSLINSRFVVTAAHCINENILKQAGLDKLHRVILGEYDTRNDTDCFYFKYGTDCADKPQYYLVDQIIEHELFNSKATVNDIALLKLDRTVTFTDYIKPICLPMNGSVSLKANEKFVITGWGKTETGILSPVKRKTTIPFTNKDNCNQLGLLSDGQMCLASDNGTDSCKGDSGGPVMRTVVRSGEYVTILVGIISFGFGRCGTTTSVSTYVPYYIDWILENSRN